MTAIRQRLEGLAAIPEHMMTDAQLDRIIMRGMTPAQRAKYRTATPEVKTAFLEQIVAGGARQ
jgi:hypothetical protein